MQDGFAIQDYITESRNKQSLINPITFMYQFEQKGAGTLIQSYPPGVSAIYAAVFFLFGRSILYIKIVHLLFAIGFFMVFYLLIKEEYNERVANFSTLFLILNFSFVKFLSILYREIIYVFFIFLSIYALKRYLRSKSPKDCSLFFLSVLMGIYTKDVFVLSLPAYAFIILADADFRWEKLWQIIKDMFLKWYTVFWMVLVAVAFFSYYILRMLLVPSTTSFLLFVSGFNPANGVLFYGKFLLIDNALLMLIFFVALIMLRSISKKKSVSKNNMTFIVLLLFYVLFMIVVPAQQERYIYIMYPIAALFCAQLIVFLENSSRKKAMALALVLVIGTVISSGLAIAKHVDIVKDTKSVVDFSPGKFLVEHNVTGNILILSDKGNIEVPYYLRSQNYNAISFSIVAAIEKGRPDQITWSRFNEVYKELPECGTTFTLPCWNRLIQKNNLTVFVVEKGMTNLDMLLLSEQLAQQQPVYETKYADIFIVPENI